MQINKGNYYNEIDGTNIIYSNLKKEIIISNHRTYREDNISVKLDEFLSNHSKALIELITQSESVTHVLGNTSCYSFTMIIFYREPKDV